MKTKQVKTNVLKYAKNVTILVSKYNNGNMYIGLNNSKGECYKDITENIVPVFGSFGYVLSTDQEAVCFIEEQKIGQNTGIQIKHNMNTYNLYYFNLEGFTEE